MDLKKHFSYLTTAEELGSGGFSAVYRCTSCDLGESSSTSECRKGFVIKVARESVQGTLLFEQKVYKALEVSKNLPVPKLLFYDKRENREILAMEQLGKSLTQIYTQDCNEQFSNRTIYAIFYQMLQILEDLHKCDVYHLDIKSDNILVGLGNPNKLYLIDFGCSVVIEDDKFFSTAPNVWVPNLPNYVTCSDGTYVQKQRKVFRDNDIYHLLNLFISFYLPEQYSQYSPLALEVLCLNCDKSSEAIVTTLFEKLPSEMYELMRYVCSTNPTENLDYTYLRCLIFKAAGPNTELSDGLFK